MTAICYRYHFKMFPVVENGNLVGCVSTRQVKDIPREDWPHRAVGDISTQCSFENTISMEADSLEAISKMNRAGASRLIVLDGDRLAGIVSLKDLLQFLSLKVELEER